MQRPESVVPVERWAERVVPMTLADHSVLKESRALLIELEISVALPSRRDYSIPGPVVGLAWRIGWP
jgi:hypothetical protein